MYKHALPHHHYHYASAPSPRSRSPLIPFPRSLLRRHKGLFVLTSIVIVILWHAFSSSSSSKRAADRGVYPQWNDVYAHKEPYHQNQLPLPQLNREPEFDIEYLRSKTKKEDAAIRRQRQRQLLRDSERSRGEGTETWDPENPEGALYEFPPYQAWLDLDAKADTLPDLMHIPLEEAVLDVKLEGWEDDWFGSATYDDQVWGKMKEPRVDFIYTWVNGSQEAFAKTMRPYELNSTLNDDAGEWLLSHGANRYRSWDELRYSVRSIGKYASSFANKIQIVVNAVDERDDPDVAGYTKQRPSWLSEVAETTGLIEVLSQEDFFGAEERTALPSFNSLTIESQLHNTPSTIDRYFAMSDDMLLGREHSAVDMYSPLFGPTMGFKDSGYNTMTPPEEEDAHKFGEKPYLIYTSWLLNRRFGMRIRAGQAHFGHSMSRSIAKEVHDSFPRPSLRSACQRFRGETGFQLYTWYAAFHYTIERHREALLYSYIMLRSDPDGDGNLGWQERARVMREIEEGMAHEDDSLGFRRRMHESVDAVHAAAGLEPSRANSKTQWTSLDGPMTIRDIDCFEFDVNECLAPGFGMPSADAVHQSTVFSTASIFDRVARQEPICGDCLVKLILGRQSAGLEPLLPPRDTMRAHREVVLKALKRYSYSVIEPDALFAMITDANQVKYTLSKELLGHTAGAKTSDWPRQVGQLCLNDDVATDDEYELMALQKAMTNLFEELYPVPSKFEI